SFLHLYAPALQLARRWHGTSGAYHVVQIPPHWGRRFEERLLQQTLATGAPVRVFSDFCARHMRENYGVEPHIVPPTVDVEAFRPSGEKDLGRPKILFTADLAQPGKGAHVLARAFNEVHRQCPDAVLQLAGPIGFN